MAKGDPLSDWVRESVGVPDRLLDSLQTDDDWTFVIKIHGLIEATLNQLLTNELNNPALHTFISRLETSDDRTGKLGLIRACGLLDKNAWAFIRSLSVLRNKLVHNIKNFDLKIPEYAAGLKRDVGRDWRNGLKSGLFGLSEIDGIPIEEYIRQEPRTAIKCACFRIMLDAFRHNLKRKKVEQEVLPSLDQSTPKK